MWTVGNAFYKTCEKLFLSLFFSFFNTTCKYCALANHWHSSIFVFKEWEFYSDEQIKTLKQSYFMYLI